MGGDKLRRWGPALLVVAVLAAGAGGAAGGLGAAPWLAGAIAAVTALVSGVFAGWYFPARDQRAGLLEAREALLDGLTDPVTSPADAAADPLSLLRADRSPMPFRGRNRELRQLAEWRDADLAGGHPGSPVLLLSGVAGVGKSRLALRFASRAPEGWAAGWLHQGTGADAVGAVAACREPALILADDADGRGDVGPLLAALAERHSDPVIRVILVSRSAEGLRLALERQLEPRHAWVITRAAALELAPEGSGDDRARWYGEAVDAFARVLDETPPTVPEVFPAGPAGGTEPFAMIQARALLAVLGGQQAGQPDAAADSLRLSFGAVAAGLLGYERRRWQAEAPAWGLSGPGTATLAAVETLQARSIAALALLGDDGDTAAEAVLRRVPELRDQPVMRLYAILAAVRGLYPAGPDGTPRIRPDVIGEWFVVGQLTASPELATALRAELSDEQAARALGLLARAADWIADAGALFNAFAGGDVRRQVLAASQAALTGQAGQHLLDAVVSGQLTVAGDWSLDQLWELDALIPGHVLLRTHLQIHCLAAAVYRARAADDPAYRDDLARTLVQVGIRLGDLGRNREAIDATAEAVALERALTAAAPDAHQGNLATALVYLGNQLDHLGRYREALDAAREAVTLYRTLTVPDSANLAAGLVSLGARHAHLGHDRAAADATEEAVTLRRALAAGDPDRYRVDLATALVSLGNQMSQLGQHREALDATQEAISLYRSSSAASLDANQTYFAMALHNLGGQLHRLDRHREALAASQEAVSLFRPLAAANPDAHQPNLARVLVSLSDGLGTARDYRGALDAAAEAVALYRQLAAANPDAHQRYLASALANLGTRFDGVGRHREALDTNQEAVALYRQLAAASPDAHQRHLAAALNNLGNQFNHLGQHREALEVTEEAVTCFRALAAANPDAHQHYLAMALDNLGNRFGRTGQHDKAVSARAEAVALYRELAARDPELYQSVYRLRLGALRREYDQRGRHDEAIGLDLEGGESAAPVPDDPSS